MEKDKSEGRNVSMYPDDWAIVDKLAERFSQSTSGALRIIVRQWAAANAQEES